MIPAGPATRIYLAVGATDARKSFNGLAALVEHQLKSDPLSGHLFVFCNKSRNRIKLLFWDGSGLWVCTKRLEKGRFSWPKDLDSEESKVSLSSEEFALLVGGIEMEKTRHKNWWRCVA